MLLFNKRHALCFFLVSLIAYLFFLHTQAIAATGINRQINFQGKVVNKTAGTNVTNGGYDFTFKLYDAASSGTLIWTENYNTANGNQLTVTDGIFRAALGSVCSFSGGSCQGNTNTAVDFNTDNLYLDVTFNGETMGTRIRFTAVPYAFMAEKVTGLSFENNESISNGTDGTIFLGRNDAGVVTLSAKDNDSTAAFVIKPGGAASLTLGDASTTGLTVTTDSTGDNEVILPTGSISGTEILDASLLPADLQITGSTADEACLTYETTGTQFEWQTCGSGTNYLQLNSGTLAPGGSASASDRLVLGGNTSTVHQLEVNGKQTGKALVALNETGDQAIFTASASGTTRFVIDKDGQVGINSDVSSDYLVNAVGDATNDYSRLLNLTQNNNAQENTTGIILTSTTDKGTTSSSFTDFGIVSNAVPTITLTQAGTLTTGGLDSTLNLSNITLSTSTSGGNYVFGTGIGSSVTGSPVFNNAGSIASELYGWGESSTINITPTLTNVVANSIFETFGGQFQNASSTAGNANLTSTAYGIQASATGDLTTAGDTVHYGGHFTASGTADENYGIKVSANDADLTIGVSTSALNNGSGTLDFVAGIDSQVGNTSTGTITTAAAGTFIVNNGTGSGNITDGYGILVNTAFNGGGTFTNNYGIYVQDQSSVGSTLSYNLYSAGATAKNYFQGLVEVDGTTQLDGTLDANGVVTLGDGGDAVTIDGSSLALQTTGAGSDITLNAVDQIILTDFANCGMLTTVSNALTCSSAPAGATNYWQLNSGALSPFSLTADLNLGATATASAKISLAGSLTRGKAVAIFNQTENQEILTASASGTTRFTLANNGSIVQTAATTTDTAYTLTANSLTSGTGLALSSSGSTFASGGKLFDLSLTTTNTLGGIKTGSALSVANTGNVTSGSDTTYGQSITLNRTGAGSGGNITGYGIYGIATGDINTDSLYGVNTAVIGANNAWGGQFTAATNDSAVYSNYIGVEGIVNHSGDNILAIAYGTKSSIVNNGGGVITNAYGSYVSVFNDSGEITNGYGIYIESNINNEVFANNYGLYINDQSAVGSTNSYNLYSAGATAKNYFQGKTGIGTTPVTTSFLKLGAATTSLSSLNITSGTAPSSPQTGDLYSDGSSIYFYGGSWKDLTTTGGGTNYWQLNAGALSPFSLTADLNLGATATASAKISLAGSLTRGKAAAIINQTEAQDIFTASSSGTTRFTIDANGNVGIGSTAPSYPLHVSKSTISTGPLAQFDATQTQINATDTNDMGLSVNHTLTASSASNDLVQRGIMVNMTNNLTGGGAISNLRGLNIKANTNASTVTTALDNIYIENGTISGVVQDSRGMLINGLQGTSRAGVAINTLSGTNNSYLVLGQSAIPSGNFGIYNAATFNNYIAGNVGIGTSSPISKLHVTGAPMQGGNALAIFNQTNSDDILTASASGATVFTLKRTGGIALSGSEGSLNNCLLSGGAGAAATWGSCVLTSYWQLNSGSLSPFAITADLNLGAVATDSAKISLAGSLTRGKAVAIFNQTENQDILAASSSGSKVFSVAKIPAAGTSGDFVSVNPSLTAMDGSDTVRGLYINFTNASHTGSANSNTLNAIDVGNITGTAATLETALNIGTGWDQGIVIASGGSTNSGLVYTGAGRPTKSITLSPEYAGGILTASSSATINGSMTSDASPSANFRTYYEWSASDGTNLQDYTVAIRTKLPKDFSAWATNAITIDYNTEVNIAADSKFDVYIYNPTDSSSVPAYFSTANKSATGKTWATLTINSTQIDDNVVADWDAADESAIIYIKMYSRRDFYTQIGDITLNYLAAF